MKALKDIFAGMFSKNNYDFEKMFASNELNQINKEIGDLKYRRSLLENIILKGSKEKTVFLRRV